jgi:hypothetical protein
MLLAALTVAVVACTGADDPPAPSEPAPSTPSSSAGGLVNVDQGRTEFVPGRFLYQYNSITARATFRDNVATVSVRNGTGATLGAPGLYVIGADDRRYDAETSDAQPIDDGEQATAVFTFPAEVGPGSIGLAILTFGDDNVGAMPPVPRGE